MTHRDASRLSQLGDVPVTPVEADVLDRAALRRAFRGARIVFHGAGVVATRPAEMVWKVNALAPRLAVEAAAAEGVERVVITSSVGGVGPATQGRAGREDDVYRGGGLGLTYVDSKHEGESEALAAGARCGIEVVVVNPAYVLGVPVNRDSAGRDVHAGSSATTCAAGCRRSSTARRTSCTSRTSRRVTCWRQSAAARASATSSAARTSPGSTWSSGSPSCRASGTPCS